MENEPDVKVDQSPNEEASQKKMNPVGIVVLLFVFGIVAYFGLNKNKKVSETIVQGTSTMQPVASSMEVSQTSTDFTIVGGNYKFDVKEIKVKKGDMVKIIFKNEEGMHDFVLDEFNAKTNVLKEGEEETLTFVADKSGTFEYYCSVGQHRKMGMVGKLVVE